MYRVLVDGSEIGQLGNGQQLQHDIHQGRHAVSAIIDWCGSRELVVDIGPEGSAVRLRSALRGWRLLLGPYYIIFNRFGYVIAEPLTRSNLHSSMGSVGTLPVRAP
jgi:hypothetical protein